MEKIDINGHIAVNFGSNNYSHGVKAVIFNPATISVEQVKALPSIYLHPTLKPNSLEIFALMGSDKQFEEFYKSAKETYCSQKAVEKFGGIPQYDDKATWKQIHDEEDRLWNDFQPWYE